MKALTTTYLLLVFGTVTSLLGTAVAQEASEVLVQKDQVAEQEKALQPVEEQVEHLLSEVKAKHRFDVSCDDIEPGQCYLGLQSLNKALAKVEPGIDRNDVSSVKIVVGDTGEWKSATQTDYEMRVSYRAHPDTLKQFLDGQMQILFLSSAQDLQKGYKEIEDEIRDKYLLKVERDTDLRFETYLVALAKLKFIVSKLYGKEGPTAEGKDKLGFDTIVVTTENRDLYENKGELRVNINHRQEYGDLGLFLARQTRDGPLSKDDIANFRENSEKVKEVTKALAQILPATEVVCQLDKSEPESLTVHTCVEGLTNLQAELSSIPNIAQCAECLAAPKIIVSDDFWKNVRQLDPHTYLVSKSASDLDLLKVFAGKK